MSDFRTLTLQAGRATQIADADSIIVGAGIKTAAGDLTVTPAGTNFTIGAGKTLNLNAQTMAAGAGSLLTGTILGGGTAVLGTGASRIGDVQTATLDASGAVVMGTTLAVTGLSTFTAAVRANGGVQRSAAGGLSIGTDANTTSLTIGTVGVMTTIQGDLTVNGVEVVVGATTFQGATTFEGNVTFGNATTDTVTFTSRLVGDLNALKEANHSILIDASTALSTAGGAWTLQSAAGSAASGATAGAAGGALTAVAGTGGAAAAGAGAGGVGALGTYGGGAGGAGTATGVAGAGGSVLLRGGAAGANGGAGGAGGGDISVLGGLASGAGVNGVANIGTSNTSAIAIGASGITTTVTGGLTQLTGAVSITGNAASSLTTSAGALTLTSAAAATWSTAAGALTVNGTGGINLQGGATTALAVNSTGTAITVQAGAVLGTTSTGNINLPSNGTVRFQIEGVAVTSASITAPNFDILFNGSNADALHVHAAGASTLVSVAGTSGAAIDAGEIVVFDDAAGVPRVFRADADGGTELQDAVGISGSTVAGAGSAVTIYVAGERSVPDAQWDSVPAVGDVGKRVYLSATAGNLTLTAPSAAGSTAIRVGWVTTGGAGAVKVLIGIGEGIVN